MRCCGLSISELMLPYEVWCGCLFRHTLEKIGQLDPYVSAVDLDEDALEAEVRTATVEYLCNDDKRRGFKKMYALAGTAATVSVSA